MLKLYIKSNCPFSAMVLKKVEDLGIEIEEKNIADEGVLDELIKKGGDDQTPFLFDPETGAFMYESSAIVEYLEKHADKKE